MTRHRDNRRSQLTPHDDPPAMANRERTMAEVAAVLGTSTQTVSVIERRALAKLWVGMQRLALDAEIVAMLNEGGE